MGEDYCNRRPQAAWFKGQKSIFHHSEARSPRPRRHQGQFLVRTLFLVCRRSPSQRILLWPLLCAWEEREKAVPLPFLIRTPGKTSLDLNYYLPRALYPNIVTLGVGAATYAFGEDNLSSPLLPHPRPAPAVPALLDHCLPQGRNSKG